MGVPHFTPTLFCAFGGLSENLLGYSTTNSRLRPIEQGSLVQQRTRKFSDHPMKEVNVYLYRESVVSAVQRRLSHANSKHGRCSVQLPPTSTGSFLSLRITFSVSNVR